MFTHAYPVGVEYQKELVSVSSCLLFLSRIRPLIFPKPFWLKAFLSCTVHRHCAIEDKRNLAVRSYSIPTTSPGTSNDDDDYDDADDDDDDDDYDDDDDDDEHDDGHYNEHDDGQYDANKNEANENDDGNSFEPPKPLDESAKCDSTR